MEEPIEQDIRLQEKCPVCTHDLYAYWHTPSSEHPECGTWYIECTNMHCVYEVDGGFTLEELFQEYKRKIQVQIELTPDMNYKITIPGLNIVTYGSNIEDVSVAIVEAVLAFSVAADQHGEGLMKELRQTGIM